MTSIYYYRTQVIQYFIFSFVYRNRTFYVDIKKLNHHLKLLHTPKNSSEGSFRHFWCTNAKGKIVVILEVTVAIFMLLGTKDNFVRYTLENTISPHSSCCIFCSNRFLFHFIFQKPPRRFKIQYFFLASIPINS